MTTAMHGDPAPPDMNPDLATARIPSGTRPIIVITSDSVTSFQARLGSWPNPSYDPAVPSMKAETQREGSVTAFVLEPASTTGDQLLLATIAFSDFASWGEANYVWRLNPAQ